MSYTFEQSINICLEAQNELIQSTPQLDYAKSNSSEKGLPPIAIGRAQGQILSILCRAVNAKNVLEIGTLGGYSTIWLANSVPGVKVTSIEYEALNHQVALENVKNVGDVEVIHGAGLDILPQLQQEGRKFDFVFIDADWESQHLYYDWAVKLTRSGGLIYIDNAIARIFEGLSEKDIQARSLIDHVKRNDGATATLMPMLHTGELKFDDALDGYVLAIVN